ncbi:hypothetical protein TOPH_06167 [Tolypocladium ophioglossoides CBS 100239]|uniref:Uncharacterized protein n=1 Tax=Tolypocladium ophioglossoides (strain CBS 100239) TaxID=1163406 RepID=A0A0L0N4X7_TOLOC|nr:hypothetical protein TOPH_06167 [Tolypocladium ophioglossoides CBS 100239]
MTTVTTMAQKAWVDTFNDGPYTSFKMLDYMLLKAGKVSYEELVKTPKVAKKVKKEDIEKDNMDKNPLFDTWGSKTGRCTSFTVKITAELAKAHPKMFDFKIYDLKGHRVARCIKTGVLIDSSSWVGAFILEEGEWKTFQDGTTSAKWKWLKGKSKFQRGNDTKVSSTVLTPIKAMAMCLTEIADKPTVVTLFRSFTDGKAGFHGMFSWVLKGKETRLEMTPNLEKRKTKLVVAWGKNGTEKDNETCVFNFAQFVMNYGGPHSKKQREADGIEKIHEGIWNALNKLWGFPKYSEEG